MPWDQPFPTNTELVLLLFWKSLVGTKHMGEKKNQHL